MFRTINPDNGYCLFFPNRQDGQRFVSGHSVRVWLWEEWHHIKLGQFEVTFPEQQGHTLFVTAEDIECSVKANFKIVIGGFPEGREERITNATISCVPTRDIKKKIEYDFFQKWSTNYCKTSIERVIKISKYVNLFEDTDYRASIKNQIEEDARTTLAMIGLILVTSTIVFEPIEPKTAAKEILDKWMEYRRTLDATEREKQQADNKDKEEKAENERKHAKIMVEIEQKKKLEAKEIEAETRIKMLDVDKREEIEKRQQLRDQEEQIKGIQEQIDTWSQTAQLQRIRRDAELEEERLRKEAEQAEQRERDAQTLANLKQQAEIQQLREKMESLELEKQILEKEMTLTESREKISRLQIELEKIRGEIKVELAEKEILAKSADVLQMRKIFMEALPKILAEANRPIEKMGEVRLLNISGIQDKTEQGGLLTGLLSSASLLPMIKDVIQFLGDLGNVGEQIQSTTQGEKGNHAPKNKSMNELVVSK